MCCLEIDKYETCFVIEPPASSTNVFSVVTGLKLIFELLLLSQMEATLRGI